MEINKENLLKLYELELDKLIEISNSITKENFDNTVEVCSIISAKTGNCGENCKYCSQSRTSKAKINCHPLLSVEEVKNAAMRAKECGAKRFCIVTSGRTVEESDFPRIIEMIEAVASIEGLHCCASLGFLSEQQIKKIKEAGVERFNHNINTSPEYYKSICSTHDFKDRVEMVEKLQKAGIEACTGVIIGMGETREDRVDMALCLRSLNPKTIPINVLNPIKGTELENYSNLISEDEILKTICIFRIAVPKAILRYAGGRDIGLSEHSQIVGLKAGINGMLMGDYLTTKGTEKSKDIEMIENLNLSLSK
ncbi:MAG: biotin synthase BioB [Candidatus Gastranaerophilaceae bacterium]